MGKEVLPLIKTTSNPTSGNTTSNGYPLGQHWFNETSGVEFIHKSNGVWDSPHTTQINILYADLVTLKNSGGLTPNMKYKITNYRTTYFFYNDNNASYTGPIEPLIVMAMTNTLLYPVCYSESYPEDVIYYNIKNPNGYGVLYGYIYGRIDTKLNNTFSFDFRGSRCRRWALNVTNAHVDGNAVYVKNSVVRHSTNGTIYIKLTNTTGLFTDTTKWYSLPSIFKNGAYISHQKNSLDIGEINIPVNNLSFADFPMFVTDASALASDNYYSLPDEMGNVSGNAILNHFGEIHDSGWPLGYYGFSVFYDSPMVANNHLSSVGTNILFGIYEGNKITGSNVSNLFEDVRYMNVVDVFNSIVSQTSDSLFYDIEYSVLSGVGESVSTKKINSMRIVSSSMLNINAVLQGLEIFNKNNINFNVALYDYPMSAPVLSLPCYKEIIEDENNNIYASYLNSSGVKVYIHI